jgi:medium-chain acyl-[acyl-carrier-protein] hydrolase
MIDLATRIAALPSEKQAALLQRLKQKANQQETDQPALPGSAERWIVRYRPKEHASLRLFCFPYAGGGASVFRSWADGLADDVELCCIQLPGREHRIGEQVYIHLAPLIQELARAILPYLDRPFAFFGYSMGALVCFELARELRRTYDRHPIHIGLAAFRAPHLPNPNIKIYHLPDEVFKVVMRADGIPEQVLKNEELMQAMLPTLRADFELCDTYQFREEPPLACPFSLFGGQEDVRVTSAALEAWHIHSSVPSTLLMLPGPHLFLHSSSDLLLTALASDLARSASHCPLYAGNERVSQWMSAHEFSKR